MKTLLHTQAKKLWLLCLISLLPVLVFAKDFVVYDDILEEKTALKIEEIVDQYTNLRENLCSLGVPA